MDGWFFFRYYHLFFNFNSHTAQIPFFSFSQQLVSLCASHRIGFMIMVQITMTNIRT